MVRSTVWAAFRVSDRVESKAWNRMDQVSISGWTMATGSFRHGSDTCVRCVHIYMYIYSYSHTHTHTQIFLRRTKGEKSVCVCVRFLGRHGQEPAPEEAIEQPIEPPSSAFTVTWPEFDRNQPKQIDGVRPPVSTDP